jgi:hypothetical protein
MQQDREYMYKRKTETLSRTHRCRGKAINIAYSKCVSVALVIQHAKRRHRIILSSVACPALQYFSTLSRKRHDFRGGGGVTEQKTRVPIFAMTSV